MISINGPMIGIAVNGILFHDLVPFEDIFFLPSVLCGKPGRNAEGIYMKPKKMRILKRGVSMS